MVLEHLFDCTSLSPGSTRLLSRFQYAGLYDSVTPSAAGSIDVQIRASLRQGPDGGWVAETEGDVRVRAAGPTPDACLASLGRCVEVGLDGRTGPVTILVEVTPVLAGVAEAAEIMRWDKRRVVTYIDRGAFPQPIQALASGRVWRRADVERFAVHWRSRLAARARRDAPTPPPVI
jgi:hypothetical protein